MFRRSLALSVLAVVFLSAVALAGVATLSAEVLNASDFEVTRSPAELAVKLEDALGDLYHPLGEPGFTDGRVDIERVGMSAWAVEIAEILEGPNPFAELAQDDGIRRGGPLGIGFSIGAPYVVAEFELGLDLTYTDELFCEYPLAWRHPDHAAFEGIPGDLFNGMNYVTVARVGAGVPGGFQVSSLELVDDTWVDMEPFGYAAASGNRLLYAIPADHFGDAADLLRQTALSFARGQEVTDSVVDFNFGAFCTEGGLTFDPSRGGVDILQAPVDLVGLPISVIGQPEPVPTTTTAVPTTLGDTPVTSVVEDEGPTDTGGGMNPLLIGLIVGGIGGAVLAGTRMLKDKTDSDQRPPGFSVRLEMEDGSVGSFSEVSGLDFEDTPVEYRSGSESQHPRKMSGISKFTNLTFKRGTVTDGSWLLEEGGVGGSGAIILSSDVTDAVKWTFRRGWPGKHSGPGLNAANNEVSMESLEFRVEGLQIELGP